MVNSRYKSPIVKVSQIDTTVNNTETMANITGLEITGLPVGIYYYFCTIMCNSGTTPDIDTKISISNGTGTRINLSASSTIRNAAISAEDELMNTTGAVIEAVTVEGIITITAAGGVITPQFAQNVATVGDTKALAGSILIIYRNQQ